MQLLQIGSSVEKMGRWLASVYEQALLGDNLQKHFFD
jgi:hypothetical protein